MRLVRIGEPASQVGADVRAALASWGPGGSVLGGVALVGVRPARGQRPIDAVILLPRGVIVVSGVDLPDPAVRLDAPLNSGWKTDGWPLVRHDGATNPGAEALAAGSAVTALLQGARVEPLPVGVVIAVGPYVKQVSQPTADLVRGVRILHPEPLTLLSAARELATHDHACAAPQAVRILEALHPNSGLSQADLVAEGFPESAPAVATTFIPKSAVAPKAAAPAQPPSAQRSRRGPRWLPVAAAALVVLLLIIGVVLALGSGDSASQEPPPERPAAPVGVDGVAFTVHGAASGPDCAAVTYGDVKAWLERNGCDEVVRARYAATADGKQAAVLVSVLRFAASATATELRAVAEEPGTGGVRDLDGAWPGGLAPTFDSAAFVTGHEGNSVKVAQAVWLDKPSDPADPDLLGIAERALRLAVTG
ncbi:hypothetical protein [Actinokineospora sp. UTMC 2448]|uniref:hypothetical protein n=1 Tax=Actinokineospora sp. UTMC 2448 TaxID=2268449 RepID=UPI00216405B4|nr:hypothetical protein [Actinokineospora sp. UTMC 2448]UVS77796.1 hypothetical protein Actkin_01517 [Actinokineospora sp. UTMC 2448]